MPCTKITPVPSSELNPVHFTPVATFFDSKNCTWKDPNFAELALRVPLLFADETSRMLLPNVLVPLELSAVRGAAAVPSGKMFGSVACASDAAMLVKASIAMNAAPRNLSFLMFSLWSDLAGLAGRPRTLLRLRGVCGGPWRHPSACSDTGVVAATVAHTTGDGQAFPGNVSHQPPLGATSRLGVGDTR